MVNAALHARKARRGFQLAVIAAWIAFHPLPAAAQLVISPLRQILTRDATAATYQISNPSDRIVDARISWVDLAATGTGYKPANPAEREKLSAAPYLVLSPSRLRIEPGKRAEVTIRLKKGARIPAGERRSHLLIETTPVRTPLRRAGGGLEVDVGLGITTPVILRSGLAAPETAFENTRLLRDVDGLLEIQTTVTRNGRYSSFGRLVASLNIDGKSDIVAEADNVAIHADAEDKKVTLPIKIDTLPPGELTLSYLGAGEYDGTLFAEKKFEIAPAQ